jgi:hypothetical protein
VLNERRVWRVPREMWCAHPPKPGG